MKRVIAVVKPNMLDDVIFALHRIDDFPGATMTEVRGIGRGFRRKMEAEPDSPSVGYPEQIRIEVICRDDQLEEIVATIEQKAHTGKSGDGKIFISPVEETVRISTGQRGDEAI